MEVGPKLRRRLLRRIAYLRRNRCSLLLAALCLFILVNPFAAGSAIAAVFLALGTLGILVLALWALRARRLTLLVVGVLALYPIYFRAANGRFVAGTIDAAAVAAELARWSSWQELRVAMGIGALVAAVVALLDRRA